MDVLPPTLTDPSGCASVEARLTDRTGLWSLLVNNAGMGTNGKFWEVPLEDEERLLALNVRAVMRARTRLWARWCPRGEGDSSTSRRWPPRADAGVRDVRREQGLGQHLQPLAAHGPVRKRVRICALQPGLVRTPVFRSERVSSSPASPRPSGWMPTASSRRPCTTCAQAMPRAFRDATTRPFGLVTRVRATEGPSSDLTGGPQFHWMTHHCPYRGGGPPRQQEGDPSVSPTNLPIRCPVSRSAPTCVRPLWVASWTSWSDGSTWASE